MVSNLWIQFREVHGPEEGGRLRLVLLVGNEAQHFVQDL